MELIYCAAGNPRFAQIAIDHGFLYGVQLPDTVYHPLYFADQDWKAPRREVYMAELAQYKPYMATVLDLERPQQWAEVMAWAEEAAAHVEEVVIIPKYSGAIASLPRWIGGKAVRLGYSVPTRYGKTDVHPDEFGNWPVHLLGGSPRNQLRLAHQMNVVSVDGNAAQRAARYLVLFDGEKWLRLRTYLGGRVEGPDLMYRTFEYSCQHLIEMWRNYEDADVMAMY